MRPPNTASPTDPSCLESILVDPGGSSARWPVPLYDGPWIPEWPSPHFVLYSLIYPFGSFSVVVDVHRGLVDMTSSLSYFMLSINVGF